MSTWPLIRTRPPGHLGYEIGHAASIALAAVLIILPLLGLGASKFLEAETAHPAVGITLYSIAQMMAYSPLVSWLGLLIGAPLVIWSVRSGYGGWLVTLGIGVILGSVVLSLIVAVMLNTVSLRIALIGGSFGALFAAVYWITMRIMSPALFRPFDRMN